MDENERALVALWLEANGHKSFWTFEVWDWGKRVGIISDEDIRRFGE